MSPKEKATTAVRGYAEGKTGSRTWPNNAARMTPKGAPRTGEWLQYNITSDNGYNWPG